MSLQTMLAPGAVAVDAESFEVSAKMPLVASWLDFTMILDAV